MTHYSIRWAEFVHNNRRARRMTMRALARAVDIDPSYITLFERDGFVPVVDKARRISQYFGKEAEGLLCAGFAPTLPDETRGFVESASFAKTGIPYRDIWATAKAHGMDRTLDAIKSAILLAKATRPEQSDTEAVA